MRTISRLIHKAQRAAWNRRHPRPTASEIRACMAVYGD